MNILAVSDAFMRPEFYKKAEEKHPGFKFTEIIEFGVNDKEQMRATAYRIERGGPEAVEAPKELYDKIGNYEALMVHLCPVTRRLIESAPKLKLIMVNRGGTENIDIEAATEHGIAVLSNPAHNANGVVELTVGLMLAESRNICRADKIMKEGRWSEKYPNCGYEYELRGLKAGLIGFGSIGKRMAKILTAFGMSVSFCDPNVPANDPDALALGCKKTDLATIMSENDFVSLHARANSVIVGKKEFDMMKPTAYFINSARPHLIDSRALYEALRDKKITGAALDVHDCEPTDPNDPFLTLDNVTLTNHRGGATVNCYADSPDMMLTEADKLVAGDVRSVKFFINRDKL